MEDVQKHVHITNPDYSMHPGTYINTVKLGKILLNRFTPSQITTLSGVLPGIVAIRAM